MESHFKHVGIIGLGLMGGSFGKALRQLDKKMTISTFDASGAKLPSMTAYETAAQAACMADLVILATPLSAYEGVLKAIGPHLKDGALVLDLGSVKGGLEALYRKWLPQDRQVQWLGGHPMCGSEKSGAAYARADLFHGASFFLTGPTASADKRPLETAKPHLNAHTAKALEKLLTAIGAQPIWVTEKEHDETVALTSHLPHLNAAALMHCTAGTANAGDYIAGGFKDATRVAAGNVQVWKDILLWNKTSVIGAIENYRSQLSAVIQLLETEDSEGLEAYLESANHLRREIPCSK